MKARQLILRNSIFVFGARALELGSGLLLVVLATRYLGAAGFGEYAFIGATTGACAPLIALGCARILVRDVAVDATRAAGLVAAALRLNGLLMGVALAVVLGVVGAAPGHSPLALVAAALAVLGQGLLVMQQTVSAVFIAREQMGYDPLIVIVSRALLLALAFAVVLTRRTYPFFFVAGLVASGAGLLVALRILHRRFARPARRVAWRDLGYLARASAPVAVYNFLGQGFAWFGVLLLTWLQGWQQVSFYQAPLRVLAPLMLLPMSLLFAFTPALARLGADPGQSARLWAGYRRATGLVLALLLPAGVLVHVLAPWLVRLCFGPGYEAATNPFRILFWTIAPYALSALSNTILTALHRQSALIGTHLAALAVNLLVGVVLVPRLGAVGASWAFLAGLLSLLGFNHVYLARRLAAPAGGPR